MKELVARVEVEVALLPSAVQKRSGYRPNHKHPRTGDFFLGEVTFETGSVEPGQTARAHVRIFLSEAELHSLLEFGSWSVWEARTHVAQIRLIDVIGFEPLITPAGCPRGAGEPTLTGSAQ